MILGGDLSLIPSLSDNTIPVGAHLSGEIIDMRINRSTVLNDSLAFERVDSSAVMVGRRRVLITGGEGQAQSITAELFEY